MTNNDIILQVKNLTVSFRAYAGKVHTRVIDTRVSFKVLSEEEIAQYIASNEWRGKAGGYGIQGLAGAFVQRIVGSHPAVMGLPLYEVSNLLRGAGWRPKAD